MTASILKTNTGVQSLKHPQTPKLAFESPPIGNVGVNADFYHAKNPGEWVFNVFGGSSRFETGSSFWFKSHLA